MKWTILASYFITAGILVLKRQSILHWLQTDTSWIDEFLLFLIAFLVALVPAIPYGVVAALFGAKYGLLAGSLINLSISSSAAISLFLLVRYVFSPRKREKASNMKGFSRLTKLTERTPFVTIMIARMLPVVPAQVVNVFAALTRMSIVTYLAATIVGKLPFIVMTTQIGYRLSGSFHWKDILYIICIYGGFLLIVGAIYKLCSPTAIKNR
ncbi:TVP38/TMEM64 family protein [Cohnella suwonensis]|uniref:TVP38/TMEM64 family membrane protein n=1 Tax=Cohnella suwonensis TaxID=696072 RepID=A0ABW0LZR1_9BACL